MDIIKQCSLTSNTHRHALSINIDDIVLYIHPIFHIGMEQVTDLRTVRHNVDGGMATNASAHILHYKIDGKFGDQDRLDISGHPSLHARRRDESVLLRQLPERPGEFCQDEVGPVDIISLECGSCA